MLPSSFDNHNNDDDVGNNPHDELSGDNVLYIICYYSKYNQKKFVFS